MEATQTQPRTLQVLQAERVDARLPAIVPGYGSLQSFELLQRQSNALAASTMVPTQYRRVIQKYDRDGNPKGPAIDNPNAVPNCMIALNMAIRMNADPIMVMQNLVIVEGRPSWSAQWVIAQINNCGRFEPLRFDLQELGPEDVESEITEWFDGARGRDKRRVKQQTKIDNIMCRAWTVQKGVVIPPGVGNSIEKAEALGLPILKGPKVSVAMAVKEGWYTKTGSKWQTMPELMLHYRSGAFFGRLYAPELLMGIPTDDEVRDMGTLVAGPDGSYAPAAATVAGVAADPLNPSIESLRAAAAAHASAEGDGDGDDTGSGHDGPGTDTSASDVAQAAAVTAASNTAAEAKPEAKAANSKPAVQDGMFGNVE